jgi:hypothetical protein
MLEHTSRNRSSSLPVKLGLKPTELITSKVAGRNPPRCRVNAGWLTTEHHYDLSLQVETRQVITLKVG